MLINTCCFLGHKNIPITNDLKSKLSKIVEKLIIYENTNTFLFGSASQFNDLCLEIVTQLKEKHPHIKRIYIRAEYPYIDEGYKRYLLTNYEDTYFPEKIINSNKAIYINRNYEMINKSQICIVYYDNSLLPTNRKSGTKIALDYATKKGKKIINIVDI